MFSRKAAGISRENAIAELKSISIGGIEQWLLIRGEDQSIPVLPFLHSRPRTSQLEPRYLQKHNFLHKAIVKP